MTLDEFAKLTQHVISDKGFDDYMPTACYPARSHFVVMSGLPPNVEPEPAVLHWAAQKAAKNEEFLVAFKIDPAHFKVIRQVGPFSEDETYAAYS